MNKILKIFVFSCLIALPLSILDYEIAKEVVFAISDALHYQSPKKVVLDERGVPYLYYKWQKGHYVGEMRRNPVTISQFAMDYLEKYKKTDDKRYKRLFLNCSDWLVENAEIRGNYSVWVYQSRITYPNFTLEPPWVSGMAQGLGLTVLAHAYNLTGDEKYLKAAQLALNAFIIPVEEGGVLHIDEDGGWWYLEYGYKGEPKPRTLNGFIYALMGIHEYYKITGDEKALFLFNKGVEELKRHLHEYDTGSWTRYDLVGTMANEKYHKVHVEQMEIMYNLTGDPIFLHYYEKWKTYSENPWNVLTKKILTKLNLAIYAFNVAVVFIGVTIIRVLAKI